MSFGTVFSNDWVDWIYNFCFWILLFDETKCQMLWWCLTLNLTVYVIYNFAKYSKPIWMLWTLITVLKYFTKGDICLVTKHIQTTFLTLACWFTKPRWLSSELQLFNGKYLRKTCCCSQCQINSSYRKINILIHQNIWWSNSANNCLNSGK